MAKDTSIKGTPTTVQTNKLGYVFIAGAAIASYPCFVFGAHFGSHVPAGLISSNTPAQTQPAQPSGKE